MKRHAIGAGPSCLVNLQRFGSWAAWATHIACLFIQACKKMKFMFFEVFQTFKKWNSCFLKIYSLFWKHSLKNYQWRTFGERRRTRKQPDDPYCELSMCTSWTHTDSIQSCMTIFVRKDAFFCDFVSFSSAPWFHDRWDFVFPMDFKLFLIWY